MTTTVRPDETSETFGVFGYHPGLDGVRGMAMVIIFLFHAGSPIFPGAVLSLSLFFTLSGFLITRLLLDEGVRQSAIDLPRFWARRLRRLLPAALLGIVFVMVLSATVWNPDPNELRTDILASLGYGANWRFLLQGHSYAQLFQAPSPLLHYWSLAIEEQFYFLLPLLVWAIARRTNSPRGFRLTLRASLLIGIAISLVVTTVAAATGNTDFVYYSLPSRAGELLVGAVAATSLGVAQLARRPAPKWATLGGTLALIALIVLCATVTRTSPWLSWGGFVGFSVISSLLIVAALPPGPLAKALSVWPLLMLGKISYGLYIYHWPVILWLTPERVGVGGAELILIQASVTLVLAIISYVLVEQPVRRGRVLHGVAARFAAPVGIVAMALAGLLVTSTLSSPARLDFAAATSVNKIPVTLPTLGETSVAFFGDSTALMTAAGFESWAATSPKISQGGGAAYYGCGIVRDGKARFAGRELTFEACRSLPEQWSQALTETKPQVAIIKVGPIEADDHLLPGDTQWRFLGDPVFDDYLTRRMTEAVDVVIDHGAIPVWLKSPLIEPERSTLLPNDDPSGDPARMKRFNAILDSVAKRRPELKIVDLAAFVKRWPAGEFDVVLRPDGVHFDPAVVTASVAPWLEAEVLKAAARKR